VKRSSSKSLPVLPIIRKSLPEERDSFNPNPQQPKKPPQPSFREQSPATEKENPSVLSEEKSAVSSAIREVVGRKPVAPTLCILRGMQAGRIFELLGESISIGRNSHSDLVLPDEVVSRDRAIAEDLAQDAFIKVLNHIDRYRPEFKFSSWLFKIANNVAIDHLRKRQLDTISIDGSPHAATAAEIEATRFEIADQAESALDELEAKELGSAIERAIATLRPEYKACIMLRHVEGRSYEEIAATLDLPLGTVKTFIHRARHQLRELLKEAR
jgi:RNA polymerase sigma-70 factor (ECF subfamily)